ncbi:lysophospholipase [Aureimonas endophytica]|uniref:Lysophospholipase n=1 Tax=Aureimonas endophytica TaxID=2027858 RepID=A0A917E2C4_9HYPH|nr:alpha/beta hydrolase [Aureimonas endophytica]GGD92563.1 lysophospholipase [Aureimonas endophytica]
MFDTRTSFDSPSGATLNLYRATARGHERGVLLVLHGLAEHAGRYARFAGEMAGRGFHVYAHDHRGHGSTSARDAPLRRFGKTEGGAKVLADCASVLTEADREHHGLPVILFGHSMGAHIALNVAIRRGAALAGLALWNADFTFGRKETLGLAALKVERALKGSDVASELFARATFGAWGRSVPDRRTEADWLSHDAAAVEAYRRDPLCGWTPTNSLAMDLLGLVRDASGEAAWARLPSALPVHVLGGAEDPATRQGAAARDLAGGLRHAGSRDVELLILEGARHEALNEIEPIRRMALAGFETWLDRILPAA